MICESRIYKIEIFTSPDKIEMAEYPIILDLISTIKDCSTPVHYTSGIMSYHYGHVAFKELSTNNGHAFELKYRTNIFLHMIVRYMYNDYYSNGFITVNSTMLGQLIRDGV